MLALKESYVLKGLLSNVKKLILKEEDIKKKVNRPFGFPKPIDDTEFRNGLLIKDIDGQAIFMKKQPVTVISNISKSTIGIKDNKKSFNNFNGFINFETNFNTGIKMTKFPNPKYVNVYFNFNYEEDNAGYISLNTDDSGQSFLKIYSILLDGEYNGSFIYELKKLVQEIILKEAKTKFQESNINFEINNSDIRIISKTKDKDSIQAINDIGDSYNTDLIKYKKLNNVNAVLIRYLDEPNKTKPLYMLRTPLTFNIFKNERFQDEFNITGNATYETNLNKIIGVMFKFKTYTFNEGQLLNVYLELNDKEHYPDNFLRIYSDILGEGEYKETFVNSFVKLIKKNLITKINKVFGKQFKQIKIDGELNPQYVTIEENDTMTGSKSTEILPINKRINPNNIELPPRPKEKGVNKDISSKPEVAVNNKTKTNNNGKDNNNKQKIVGATKAYPKLPKLREDFNNIKLQDIVKQVINEEINKLKNKKKI